MSIIQSIENAITGAKFGRSRLEEIERLLKKELNANS